MYFMKTDGRKTLRTGKNSPQFYNTPPEYYPFHTEGTEQHATPDKRLEFPTSLRAKLAEMSVRPGTYGATSLQ